MHGSPVISPLTFCELTSRARARLSASPLLFTDFELDDYSSKLVVIVDCTITRLKLSKCTGIEYLLLHYKFCISVLRMNESGRWQCVHRNAVIIQIYISIMLDDNRARNREPRCTSVGNLFSNSRDAKGRRALCVCVCVTNEIPRRPKLPRTLPDVSLLLTVIGGYSDCGIPAFASNSASRFPHPCRLPYNLRIRYSCTDPSRVFLIRRDSDSRFVTSRLETLTGHHAAKKN